MGRRSQVDQRLAEELANGQTLAKAAEAAGCSVRTAERRWAEPAFRHLVIQLQEDGRREREAHLHATWQLGVRLLYPALSALQQTLQDPNASHLDKARAARVLLRAYGPKEEPPPPRILSVEQEQQAAAWQQAIEELKARNVVDMAAHRPPPPPQPPQPARPPVAIHLEPYRQLCDDEDDDEDPEPAEVRPAATVGQEYAKELPSEPRGTPERVGPEPAAAEVVPVDEAAEAWRFLREHPHRPAAGPDGLLMRWLQARKVVGLDQEPQPVRRRRRRGR